MLKRTAPTEVTLLSGVTSLGDRRVTQGTGNVGVANNGGGYVHAGFDV
jgi:hypothetical protein